MQPPGIKTFEDVEEFFIPIAIPLSIPKKASVAMVYIPFCINKCSSDRLVNKMYS